MNTATSNIKYNGPDITDLNIKNGDSLNDFISKLVNVVVNVTNAEVRLSAGEAPLKMNDALSLLIKRVGELDIKDLGYSDMPVIPKSLSYEGIKISSLKIPGNYSISGDNLVFSFDYSSLQSFGELSSRTLVVGKEQGRQQTLQETFLNVGSVNIPLGKIPAHIDIQIIVKTKNGDIILTKSENIYSPVSRNTFLVFEVKDFTSNPENKRSVNEFLASVDRRISELEVMKSFISHYEISGLENIGEQKGFFSSVSNLASFSNSLKDELVSLNEVTIPGQTKKMSIQEVMNVFADQYTILSNALKKKDSEIEILNGELNKLSGLYTSVLNNLSGGTSVKVSQSVGSGPSGGGGCIGAGCGGGSIIIENGDTIENNEMDSYLDPEELNDASLLKFALTGVSFIDFYSDNCSPCTQMEPVVGYLNGYFNSEILTVNFGKINVSSNIQSKQNYAIQGTPTFIIFKDGVEIDRVIGVNSFAFLKTKIESYL